MNIYRLLPHFILVILAERKLRRLNQIDTTFDSLIDKSYFVIGRKESK